MLTTAVSTSETTVKKNQSRSILAAWTVTRQVFRLRLVDKSTIELIMLSPIIVDIQHKHAEILAWEFHPI